MTRAEYYKNYKLSRKLSMLDLTWMVFVVATGFGLVTFERMGWLDSWFFVILYCFVLCISLSILMNWVFTKKLRKFNLTCPVCQHDLSNAVGMTIATGKCQKCGYDIFDPDTTIDLPPYLGKTKIQMLEFGRKMSRRLWALLILWVIVFIVLLLLSIYLNDFEIKIAVGLMTVLIIAGIYLIAFLQHFQARREGFVCPTCNVVLRDPRMEIAVKTGNCSRCGKRLFEDE